jgi:hypothetical protein
MKKTNRRSRPYLPARAASASRRRESRGLVRALVRRGSRSDQSPAVVHKCPPLCDPTLCPGCGAVFTRKTWRRSARRTLEALRRKAPGSLCPACHQREEHHPLGRVRLEGGYVQRHVGEIRRRILTVAARAQ